jgi:energy-coupling factor transporter ATPase
MSAIIQLESLSFAYRDPQGGSFPVLHDLSLSIEEGELAAVVGANGSGKTTLIRHLNGLLLPTNGRVRVCGLDTRDASARRSLHQQVGMVFQHPEDQIIAATLEDDVAFGPENLGLPAAEIQQRVEEALQAVGLWEVRQRPPHLLSAGQEQRLALAGVLAMRPRVILFDEATTMLDPAGRQMALEWMLRLNKQGLTILYVTHHMEEAALARRVIALHEGRVALDGAPRQVFADPAALAHLGLDLPPAALLANRLRPSLPDLPAGILTAGELRQAIITIPKFPIRYESRLENSKPFQPVDASSTPLNHVSRFTFHEPITAPAPLITVSHLSHTYLEGTPLEHPSLHDVSLAVAEGVSHGLLGRTGSGKSTLLQHLNGLLRPASGSGAKVQVGPYNLADPATLTRSVIQLVGLVFQNPEMQFFEQFVGDEIAYGPRQMPSEVKLAERVRAAMELVGLDFAAFKDRLLFSLSGGERRKVALASILALQPAILLLDEPTAGLDPRSHDEIMAQLQALQATGKTLVVSSHRMEDLAELAGALTLFDDGRSLVSGLLFEVFERQELLEGAGLEQPLAVQAAGWLRAQGWPLPQEVVTPDQLVETATAAAGACP